MCDDDCTHCGARHMSPYDNDDLTVIVEEQAGEFIVYRSPSTAEHHPNYERMGTFSTLKQAETYLATKPQNTMRGDRRRHIISGDATS